MRNYAQVGVRELRQNLSQYLRRVERGETLEVTERGQAVAMLTPLPAARDGVIARLQLQGRIVQAAQGNLADLPSPAPGSPGRRLSKLLDELREEST